MLVLSLILFLPLVHQNQRLSLQLLGAALLVLHSVFAIAWFFSVLAMAAMATTYVN
jgi:hypothetical protein